jgi:hypothetical protein
MLARKEYDEAERLFDAAVKEGHVSSLLRRKERLLHFNNP